MVPPFFCPLFTLLANAAVNSSFAEKMAVLWTPCALFADFADFVGYSMKVFSSALPSQRSCCQPVVPTSLWTWPTSSSRSQLRRRKWRPVLPRPSHRSSRQSTSFLNITRIEENLNFILLDSQLDFQTNATIMKNDIMCCNISLWADFKLKNVINIHRV
jgi:hypothetical protein